MDLLARFRPHGPVVLVVLIHGGRPRDHLAVDRGEDEHALRALRRLGQQDPLELLACGWVEHQELPLPGIDLERVVARQPGDGVGVKTGAVHHQAGAYALARGALHHETAAITPDGGHPEAGSQLAAVTSGRQRERERVRDRVGDSLSGHLQVAVLAEQDLDAVAIRVRGQRSDDVAPRVARAQARPAAQHRHAKGAEHGISEHRRAQDQLRLELARDGVEAGVEDSRVGPTRGQGGLLLGLQHDHRDASAGQRKRGRGAHDPGPDDRHLSVLGCRQDVLAERAY